MKSSVVLLYNVVFPELLSNVFLAFWCSSDANEQLIPCFSVNRHHYIIKYFSTQACRWKCDNQTLAKLMLEYGYICLNYTTHFCSIWPLMISSSWTTKSLMVFDIWSPRFKLTLIILCKLKRTQMHTKCNTHSSALSYLPHPCLSLCC